MANATQILSQMSQSNWLKGKDIDGQNVKVIIESVEIGTQKGQDGKDRPQFVLHFRGTEKKMGLNVGNTQAMIKLFGEESDNWNGKEIVLHTVTTQNKAGEAVPGIRIKSSEPEKVVTLGDMPSDNEMPMDTQDNFFPQEEINVEDVPV